MRAFDVSGVGLALVMVPALGWLLGRIVGRRDWSIGKMLAASLLLTFVIQLDLLAVLSWLESQSGAASKSFGVLFERRGIEALGSPEFPAFLFIFGAFIAMLGWSATPTKAKTEA